MKPVQPTDDLAARLAHARLPLTPGPRPRLRISRELNAARRLQRLLPVGLALAWGERQGERKWAEDPWEQVDARATIEAIVGRNARAAEIEVLARERVIEKQLFEVLFWRRWPRPVIDEQARGRLFAALDAGRPVLLSSCHLGPHFLVTRPLLDAGYSAPFTTAAPWIYEELPNDDWGRRMRHWRRMIAALEHRLVFAKGSYPVLLELLRQGELVHVLFDLPGSVETELLGKRVMLTAGTSRLAIDAGALVVVLHARREGHRVRIEVPPPLDAREHEDVESLHRALAAVHERHILETPGALEDPRRDGAWGAGAGVEAWDLPG